jgi:hypothetical protein
MKTISKSIKNSEYAVRGAIPMEAERISHLIATGDQSFPFD